MSKKIFGRGLHAEDPFFIRGLSMEGQYVTREEFSKLDDKVEELQKEQTQPRKELVTLSRI